MSVFEILALVFFALAFVLLAVSVTIFFTNDIASVMGDLSGITRRKQIEQIRNQTVNMSYGVKKPRSNHNAVIDNMLANTSERAEVQNNALKSRNNSQRADNRSQHNTPKTIQAFNSVSKAVTSNGTVSLDNVSENGNYVKKKQISKGSWYDTEAETDVLSQTVNADAEVETEKPTDILGDNEIGNPTDLFSKDEIATEVLTFHDTDENLGETSVLNDEDRGTTVLSNDSIESVDFDIIDDDTFINTNEVIE